MSASATQTQAGVKYEVRDSVAYLTLDAPPLNILTGHMMLELASAVERAEADPSLKAVAIGAAGKAFSAGADVAEHRPENAPAMIAAFSRLFAVLGRCPVPIVMAVDGAALGAGFELALMADILIATTHATFGQPEIRLGFFAPVGVALLPSRVGVARAVEITATGRTYSAVEMAGMGLVSRVVLPTELSAFVEGTLGDLRKSSAAVLRMNVRLARALAGQPFENARQEAERVFVDELIELEDVDEGVSAFFEKRKPEWRNR